MVSKQVYGPLVILIRILPVLLSMPERGDFCTPVGVRVETSIPYYVKHINLTTGEVKCCKKILCYAGQEVVFCSQFNSNTTSCRKCAPGTFSPDNQESHMNPLCRPWKPCHSKLGLIANNDGTDKSDRTCRCNVAEGYYENIFGGECDLQQNKCEPNHELNEKNGRCQPCRPGSQQPVFGYGPCTPCPPHTHIPDGKLECTACPKGTFKPDHGSGKCRTCEELRKRDEHVKECDTVGNFTPKIDASTENKGGISVAVAAVLGVLGFVALIAIILVASLFLYRRRKETKKPPSPKKAPRSPTHAVRTYAPVPDNSSHSSAEEAIDAFKAKDENRMNTNIQNINEKSKLGPQTSPAADGLPNNGYVHQGQGEPNGVAGNPDVVPNGMTGIPNGMGAYPHNNLPPLRGNYNIYCAPNCAVIVGDGGTVHNQTAGGMGAPTPPGYLPTVHQRAAVVATNPAHQMGQPDCDGDDSGHQGEDYYEDPADRIAAQFAAGTPC